MYMHVSADIACCGYSPKNSSVNALTTSIEQILNRSADITGRETISFKFLTCDMLDIYFILVKKPKIDAEYRKPAEHWGGIPWRRLRDVILCCQ